MRMLATTEQMRELDRTAIEERGPLSGADGERRPGGGPGGGRLVGPVKGPRPDGRIGGAVSVAVLTSRGEPDDPGGAAGGGRDTGCGGVQEQRPHPADRSVLRPGEQRRDGIAAARLLREWGYRVRAFLVGDRTKMTPDARAMEERLAEAGGALEPLDLEDRLLTAWLSTCDCYVDALFGVGLKRPVEGDFLAAVRWMNGRRAPVVSCDLPSGVDGDTGEVLGEAVRAHTTVTFTCAKPGLYLGAGAGCAGEVQEADIGIPWDLVHQMIWRGPEPIELNPNDMHWVLPRRPADGHKGDFGRVFILGGSEGYTGAPTLAAGRAADWRGAGLCGGPPGNLSCHSHKM